MSIYENILLALAGLKAGKMRALLTMLGIIIGIGAVIAIVTVGDALTGTIVDQMQGLGANNIFVGIQQKSLGGSTMVVTTDSMTAPTEEDLITNEMIEYMSDVLGDRIEAVSISQAAGSGKAQDGRKYANVNISGVNDEYHIANNIKMQKGRFIADRDIRGMKEIAVVSDKLVKKMFAKGEDPLGKEVKVYTSEEIYTYVIVGVYEYEKNALMMSSTSEEDEYTSIYIPIDNAVKMTGGQKGFETFSVTAKPGENASKLSDDITDTLNIYYKNNTNFEVIAQSMESMLETLNVMLGTVSIAIAVIAGISLIVGGIGVMNIMLVSVTERTREIGTRKALGARGGAIKMQFIVESIIICLIGGMIGIVVGILLGNLGGMILGAKEVNISVPAVVFAVVFSTLIGIFFGYYPANKASKLNPIEALRYE